MMDIWKCRAEKKSKKNTLRYGGKSECNVSMSEVTRLSKSSTKIKFKTVQGKTIVLIVSKIRHESQGTGLCGSLWIKSACWMKSSIKMEEVNK